MQINNENIGKHTTFDCLVENNKSCRDNDMVCAAKLSWIVATINCTIAGFPIAKLTTSLRECCTFEVEMLRRSNWARNYLMADNWVRLKSGIRRTPHRNSLLAKELACKNHVIQKIEPLKIDHDKMFNRELRTLHRKLFAAATNDELI